MPATLSKDDEIWNAAIDAAIKAIQKAPVFKKGDARRSDYLLMDRVALRTLCICVEKTKALRRT